MTFFFCIPRHLILNPPKLEPMVSNCYGEPIANLAYTYEEYDNTVIEPEYVDDHTTKRASR